MLLRSFVLAVITTGLLVPSALGRVWKDATGNFSVEAKMLGVSDGKVRLKKADGKTITVPLERLSEADRQYVASHDKSSKQGDTNKSISKLKKSAKAEWNKTIMLGSDNKQKPATLIVAVKLLGKPAAQASYYGFVKVTKAIDEKGRSLDLKKAQFDFNDPAKTFVKIDRKSSFFSKHPKNGVRVPLEFEHPNPKPKNIALVEGTLKLKTGGRREVITVTGLSEKEKTVKDAALPEGMTIKAKILPASDMSFGKEVVQIETEGDKQNVIQVEVVDANDKDLSQSTSSSQAGDQGMFTIMLKEKSSPKMKLKITLHLDAVEMDVPFSFKNLKVPAPPKPGEGFKFKFGFKSP